MPLAAERPLGPLNFPPPSGQVDFAAIAARWVVKSKWLERSCEGQHQHHRDRPVGRHRGRHVGHHLVARAWIASEWASYAAFDLIQLGDERCIARTRFLF